MLVGFAVYSLSFKNRLQHETKPLKKVTLGVEMSLLPISVWVAKNKEYFNGNRLDLTIKGFDSGKLSFLAMLNGEVDISTVAPTPIVFSSFTRQDFCIFSSFVYSYDDIKVIVSKAKGINSAQDLKGKRIGTPFGTTGQFYTEAFLIQNRVLRSELDIFVKTNKEILKNFIKAVDKATMFAKNNREESINIIESPVFALLYIADANGYLAEEGLEVTYNSFTSGRDALASVIKGDSDLATVYETPVVLKTLEGQKLSVITELHNSTRNTALVARKDKGILVPADLKDKTIAVSKETSGEFFLFLFLTNKGIHLTDVTFVDTKPEDMVHVLKDGKVDAVATWNPNLFNVKSMFKPEEIVTFYSNEYTEASVLAGKNEFIKERHEAMKKLLKGLVRA